MPTRVVVFHDQTTKSTCISDSFSQQCGRENYNEPQSHNFIFLSADEPLIPCSQLLFAQTSQCYRNTDQVVINLR